MSIPSEFLKKCYYQGINDGLEIGLKRDLGAINPKHIIMTITQADIQKLASLSRMKLTEEEQATFAKDIDSILGYVEQIKEVSSGANAGGTGTTVSHADKKPSDIPHRNAMREDIADTNLNSDASVLVDAAPAHEQGFVKVKKILG